MNSSRKRRLRFGSTGFRVILTLLSCLAMLAACGTLFGFRDPVPIVRQPFTQEGHYETIDYRLTYGYRVRPAASLGPDRFDFEGTLTPRRALSTLTVRIFFLDAYGNALTVKPIYATAARGGARQTDIEKRFELPPDAVSFGFGDYSQERIERP